MTNNVKATATANVDEHGIASTSNITYNEQLVPGHTYAVNAKYKQNDNYLQGVGVGELEILKIPTTTTITGSNNITYGDSVTLTVIVKENLNNSNLSRGTITVYDGNQVIQSNYAVTGQSTSISFIPQTTGTHDIYAVYNDTGVEYNNSTSNHVNITVNKLNSTITVNNSLTMYFGDTATISGTLKQGNNNLSGQSVSLIDYDDTVLQTVTTAQDGTFSFSYSPQNWNIHNHNLKIQYNGTNTINSSTKTIPVTLQRHDVTISLPQNIEGFIDDIVNIGAIVLDENNNNVTSGTLEWSITKTFFNPNKFYKGVVNNNDTLVVSDTSGNTYEWELDEGEYMENDELFVVILEDNVQSLEISESNVTITNPQTLYVSPEEIEGLYGYIIDNGNEYYETIHDNFYSQENIMLWNGSTQTQYIAEPVFEIHNITLHYTARQGQQNIFTLDSEEYTDEELARLLGDHVADIQYEEGNTGTVQSIGYSSYYEGTIAVTTINTTQSHEWIIQIGTAIYKMTYTLP